MPLDALFEARWSSLKADLAVEEVADMKLRMYNRLSLDRMALSKLVEEATAKRRLPDLYRELSSTEASFYKRRDNFGCSLFLLIIYLGVYAISYLGVLSLLIYIPYLWICWHLFGDTEELKIKRGGKARLITEAALQEIALWEAFKQMLAELKVFDQEGLRDHVLWNRYLVYGTLLV